MQYRKQKQWIEFILRLLPFLMLLLYVIAHILSFQKTGNISALFDDLVTFFVNVIGEFNESLFNLDDMNSIGYLFVNIRDWVFENITNNVIISFIINILVYETLLSLIFLLFDFINFIIEFARKWLGGLYGKEN